jgi:KRAB domain-containing zinc finger protein
MASLYAGTELNNVYTDTQELLQIPYEDRLARGTISPRMRESFASTAWSSTEWKCPECPAIPATFKNILDLNAHIHKTHRLRYRTTCAICQKPTHHFAAYLNHMIECHVPQNKFCCILCPDATFRWNLNDLYAHYRASHKSQKVTFCLYCGLHFICGAKLKEHLIKKHKRRVEDSDKFSCDICGWVTNIRCSMKTHMIKHIREPTFMCDQCVVSFPTSSYLAIHMRETHSNSIIKCTKCEKTFRTPRRLRAHDRAVHQENNKTFMCTVCNKGFHAQYRLNAHLLGHQQAFMEERFQCPHCERKFRYKPGMQYHIRSAHTGEKPYSCPIDGCFERFYDYSNAKKHITGAHGSTLKAIRD